MMRYYSELGQDRVVDNFLNGKTDGYFVDIGAADPIDRNNSYFFEKEKNWRGLAVELESHYTKSWIDNRPNSIYIIADAITLDYQKILDDNNAPKIIDFLSLDLEPPAITFEAAKLILNTDYKFRMIAFEVDNHRTDQDGNKISVTQESREFFRSRGYTLLNEIFTCRGGYHIDDIWVNNDHN